MKISVSRTLKRSASTTSSVLSVEVSSLAPVLKAVSVFLAACLSTFKRLAVFVAQCVLAGAIGGGVAVYKVPIHVNAPTTQGDNGSTSKKATTA